MRSTSISLIYHEVNDTMSIGVWLCEMTLERVRKSNYKGDSEKVTTRGVQ